jgi:hypothetical protein
MKDRRRSLRGDRRFGRRLGIWCLTVVTLLFLLAANLWLHSAPGPDAGDVSLNALKAAYARVVPGETAAPELTKIGFDTGRGGVKRLSYLGLMEYFAPRDGGGFDRLDPAAQKCLSTPNGCGAYLFRLARAQGSEQKAAFGFVNAAEAANAPAGIEVLFLSHDGRVAYKAMSGV